MAQSVTVTAQRYHPPVIRMVYGHSELMRISWATLVKTYGAALGELQFDTLFLEDFDGSPFQRRPMMWPCPPFPLDGPPGWRISRRPTRGMRSQRLHLQTVAREWDRFEYALTGMDVE